MAELIVPSVDFSSLGQLPQVIRQNQADALRRQTLANLGQGGQVDAQTLLRSGDPSLAQLGINMQNRQADLERQARQDAFQREESARAQRNADRSYGLQVRSADRADADKFGIKEVTDPNTGATSFVKYNTRTGEVSPTGGAPIGPSAPNNPFSDGGKFNEGEGKAAGFTDRMLQSEGILRSPNGKPGSTAWIHDQGVDFAQTQLSNAEKAPLVGRFSNYAISEDRQKYNQAKRDFINAQLRRESGAVISPEEFANADKQYFPVPGDSQDVINQKAQNRRAAVEAMGREGGKSYRPKSIYTADGRVVPLPKVGELKDGYRFKGGDPANPNSWAKSQ